MSAAVVLLPSPPDTSHRHRVPLFQPTKPATSTPDDSPASFLPSSGTGSRKRVEFSPWPNILDPPIPEQPLEQSILKTLPKSKDCQTTAKSILKPQAERQTAIGLDGTLDETPPITMDSLVQALGNNDKITSTDAYQSLANLIKAYDEIPEDTDTCGNVASIARSIKRDLLVQSTPSHSPIDINLITQALKVTVILVWSEHFSSFIPDDFKIFITDKAISVLADHSAPKVVVVHYMHVLAMQNFKTALFVSGTRTVKLLDALKEITNHVQGKGVVAERLLVYQKLIEQARPVMKNRPTLWAKEVLLGLSSTVKEIRDKAISVSSRAVSAFPTTPAIAQAVRDALAEEMKDRTLSELLSQRLDRMIAAKVDASQVPQIWSLVMLLCNLPDDHLDGWKHIRDWLRVIQRCFNCSDTNVRIQAFSAWNRFVFVVKPHQASESTMSMLAKPIMSQIERSGTKSSGKGPRSAAISSYCNLLYYAFRPAATHKQNTRSWNHYIVKMVTSHFLSTTSANADLCCRILITLFWKDEGVFRVWNENRAHDNKFMEPEELPKIDCKWVRAKASPILEIFQLLFKYSVWGPSENPSDHSFVAKAWRSFLKSLKESACKEIKQSTDTKRAIGAVINFLNRISLVGTSDVGNQGIWQARAKLACSMALAELGPMAILDAYDPAESSRTQDALFPEILSHLFHKLVMTRRNSANSTAMLPFDLQKSLSYFNDRLIHAYTHARQDDGNLAEILNESIEAVRMIPDVALVECLQAIEPGLALFLRDECGICRTLPLDSVTTPAWLKFSEAIVATLAKISQDDCANIDMLVAAGMSSKNAFTVLDMMAHWIIVEVDASTSVTAIRLETSLGRLVEMMFNKARIGTPSCTELNNPEVQQSSKPRSELIIQRRPAEMDENEHLDFLIQQARKRQQSEEEQDNRESDKLEGSIIGPMIDTGRQYRLRSETLFESQPLETLPTRVDEMNSQVPISNLKGNRHRQIVDNTIVFPDIESSLQKKTSTSSRAASVDCEMARKIAASENLPTTPTINRHAISMDEKAMPSPTPKSRKRTSYMADIEIPSSPPSATVNRQNDIEFAVPQSSPANTTSIVNFEDDRNGRNIAISAEILDTPQIQPLVASSPTSAHGPSSLQTTFQPDVRSQHEQRRTEPREPTTSDSDDDPCGSQLSQNLDWHILESKTSNHSALVPSSDPTHTRKRKRKEVNYAELSGQHRRKRPSTGTTDTGRNLRSSSAGEEEPKGYTRMIPLSQLPSRTSSGTLSSPGPASARAARDQCLPQPSSWPLSTSPPGKISTSLLEGARDRTHQAALPDIHNDGADTAHGSIKSDIKYSTPSKTSSVSGSTQQIVSEQSREEIQYTEKEQQTQAQGETRSDGAPGHMNIMSALQMALDGLQNSDESSSIDLKAVDDLCFQIRFQAQEISRTRMQR